MENYLHISDNFAKFVAWIGGSCKPSEKGKLTPFPHFTFCQHNFYNVSNMLSYEELPEINSERWLSLEDLPGEEWRDVVGFEIKLQVSNYGRVKCKGYTYWHPRSGDTRHKPQIYRQRPNKKGYMFVGFYCEGKNYNLKVHRLVAKAFLINTNNYPAVNHKDENPSNNCVYNLEWCTTKYNNNYGTINARRRANRIERCTTRNVVLYDYEGHILKEYQTIKDAGIDNGLPIQTVINCCKGITPTAKGLHFRFKEEKYKKRTINRFENSKINIYKENKLVFSSTMICDVADFLNIKRLPFFRLLYGKTKRCRRISEYTITVEKTDGVKYLIKNGMIEHG